ncbi:hypothetical protein HTVC309P_gp29 [Pelagibacter phage HTVC309P]|nr:hypothetical protein HTVC309P_gp29 [Pelagibacter phage HTVC309P]
MAKNGLYANIHKKRARIKAGSGEKMRKAGQKVGLPQLNLKERPKLPNHSCVTFIGSNSLTQS